MHILKTPDGKAHIYYDDPDLSGVSPQTTVLYPTLDVEHEHVELDTTVAEFEAAAREDAGITEDEPLGEVFVEDEPDANALAFGSPAHGPGKRVGHHRALRVTAYAPSVNNAATELMGELGKRSNQTITWSDMQKLMERMNG